jgi:predicted ABC-type ATPase
MRARDFDKKFDRGDSVSAELDLSKETRLDQEQRQVTTHTPTVIVLAGPNGAGKTTAAPRLLRDVFGVVEFVNADVIAQGLAGFNPEIAALEAGTIMFDRIRQLGDLRRSFAFETTLASRSLAPWISELIQTGYEFNLVFLWLPSADLAVQRVADRVRLGGHNVPEDTVRRRYKRGLQNFFNLYQPLATAWRMYDNTDAVDMRLIAEGNKIAMTTISDRPLWEQIQKEYRHGN